MFTIRDVSELHARGNLVEHFWLCISQGNYVVFDDSSTNYRLSERLDYSESIKIIQLFISKSFASFYR